MKDLILWIGRDSELKRKILFTFASKPSERVVLRCSKSFFDNSKAHLPANWKLARPVFRKQAGSDPAKGGTPVSLG
jgi:hypothetical protein